MTNRFVEIIKFSNHILLICVIGLDDRYLDRFIWSKYFNFFKFLNNFYKENFERVTDESFVHYKYI